MNYAHGRILKKAGRVLLIAAISLGSSSSLSVAADKMKLTFNWTADEGDLGFILAKKLGFYEKAGIDIEFEEGRGSSITSQLVATGQTDVGYADAPAALGVAAKGANFRIIAPILEGNTSAAISLKEAGITSMKDMKGKKIAVCNGCSQAALLEPLLKANGLERSDLEVINVDGAAFIGLLTEKQVDVVLSDPGSISAPLRDRGIDTTAIMYRDNGVPTIGLSLIARQDKLEANPDLYKRFLDATLKGWDAARQDPDAAADALLEMYPKANSKDAILWSAKTLIIPALCIQGAKTLGDVPEANWNLNYELLTKYLGLPTTKPIAEYYTRDYLPANAPSCP
ncbi:ABC transporter substrate-binding protein [Mesorhizobium sp.]|uniref:ABC transporter substrate-binding protein n=1 Tax=Mesorhizobium sp. TaxID=1871066 RepID=UPI00121A6C4C|nr:ABC transporter substrate-binding protein [Mesorhizobium sp.]TIP18356.1 MAG: ABC transporter substrate-binding protein [Mesorhizobium sp.]